MSTTHISTMPSSYGKPFTIPERVQGAMNGSAFMSTLLDMGLTQEREMAFYQQFELGNMPSWMRTWKELVLTALGHSLRIFVMPDYLCVGDDEDYCRTPLNPMTAQLVADLFSSSLPTPYLVDQIYKLADVQLTPHPLPPDAKMTSTKRFMEHNDRIEKALARRRGLIAGHKKDVVISALIAKKPGKVGIYGWHKPGGGYWQDLNFSSHDIFYADYSHGIRLISNYVELDGQQADLRDILEDTELSGLVSREGPFKCHRYPTMWPPPKPPTFEP